MEVIKPNRRSKYTTEYAGHGAGEDESLQPSPVPSEGRVIDGSKAEIDLFWEHGLRPQRFEDFPGQDRVKEKLKVFVAAAKGRSEPLDHILLSGPPGLGKTTLAHIVANTMGVDFKSTSGPALDKKGDIAAILSALKPHSVLFIDEIHRLNRTIEEYLYSAMETSTSTS